MAERIRIQKAIANAGLMSRRAAEDAITRGRVRLDDKAVRLGDRVDVEAEVLTLDGSPIPVNPALETHLLYKPVGAISTASDPQGRETVVDLMSPATRLYPVGRLDSDSEGLILMTNDGELANRVTHPRYGITKRYLARVKGTPSPAKLRTLTSGVALDDGTATAQSAHLVDGLETESLVEIVMVEGRNREVRRMMSHIGHEVTRLVRTAIGPLADPTLEPGTSRRLTNTEIQALLRSETSV